MWERIEPKLRDIARRAGVADVPPQVVAAALVLCAVACVWALWRWWPRDADAGDGVVAAASVLEDVGVSGGSPEAPAAGVAEASSAPEAGLFVHVAGAVRRPGLYELAPRARVADAITAAGGMLPDAVAQGVNLARPLSDGEQIIVPDEDDPVAPLASGGALGAGGGAPAASPVNVNTGDATLLETLPGIGPATAAKIIAEREANGPFSSVEDLERVSGIGPKKLEQLAGAACVR